jgi:hypothetical protein
MMFAVAAWLDKMIDSVSAHVMDEQVSQRRVIIIMMGDQVW